MAKNPQQPDLFDWKPEENNSSLSENIKYDYASIAVGVLILIIILVFIGFIIYQIVKFATAAETRNYVLNHWLIIFGSLSMILTFLFIWLIPKYQTKSLNTKKGNENQSEFDLEKERIKLRDDTRKTMAQIIGGVFFVLGLFVTYNTFELNREGQVTERFSKAVELIGSKELSVRLGGLYALERIANDSPKDHITVMEILAAYIRENSMKEPPETEPVPVPKIDEKQIAETFQEEPLKDVYDVATTDVFAAITIINRRNIINDKERLKFDFTLANLNGVDIRYADFDEAIFDGTTFQGAVLSMSDFSYAKFQNANLKNADLMASDLISANLTNANLENANLKRVNFQAANLQGANLQGAYLRYADFGNVNLSNCKGLTFEQLSEAIINGATSLPSHLERHRAELLELSVKNAEGKKTEH